MRKNANGHRVIVLTLDTIGDFITIPDEIRQKYEIGELKHAHYADVARMMILAKYGGLWLDATVLVTSPVDENAFKKPFFSIKKNDAGNPYVSRGKWIVGMTMVFAPF